VGGRLEIADHEREFVAAVQSAVREGRIIRTNAPNGPFGGGGYWCVAHLDLQARPASGGRLLSGTWQSPGCGRGTAFELRK